MPPAPPALAGLAKALLAVLVVTAAAYLGGAPAPAVPLCATVALLALAAAGVDPAAARRDPLAWAAGVVLGVTALQLLPLPPGLLRLFDPRSADVSAEALAPFRVDRHGAFRALHLDPGNGWADLQYLTGLTAAYLAAKQLTARGHGAALRLLAAGVPLAVSAAALAHALAGVDRVYGLYAPREASPVLVAPLLNANHLSGFAGAGAILWAGRGMADAAAARRWGARAAALVCGAVCVVSVSRGGSAAALGGLVLLLVVAVAAAVETDGRAVPSWALSAAVTVCAVVSAGLYAGWEALREEHRTNGLQKFGFIAAAFRAGVGHRALGTGAGGLYTAAAGARGPIADIAVPRAECLPVDLALAFGPALAAGVLALGLAWIWSVRPRARSAPIEQVAVFCALASLLVHDLVDFALWLGATGYLAAVLAGVLAGEHAAGVARAAYAAGSAPRASRSVRAPWLVAAAASAAAGVVTARSTTEVDRARWTAALQSGEDLGEAAMRDALLRHPGDPYLPLVGASLMLRARDPRALRFVNRAMVLGPGWGQPHAILAQVLAARGLRSQALVELTLAVGLTAQSHRRMVELLFALGARPEEIARAVPAGALRLEFLRELGRAARYTPFGPDADALLLTYAPTDLDALLRVAERARVAGDPRAASAAWEQVIAAHPDVAEGYLGLCDLRLAATDLDGAAVALDRCAARAGASGPYAQRRAVLQARRGDTVGMRQTVAQILDAYASGVDQRIAAYALLGDLELSLRHEGAALAAYERADEMAAPEHPYLEAIARIAAQFDDTARLRSACSTLRDLGPLTPARQQLCNVADPAPLAP